MKNVIAALGPLVAVMAVLGGAQTSRGADEVGRYFPPPESQGGWRKLEDAGEIRRLAGLNPAKLDELREWLLKSDDRGFAAVVIRNGYIALEVERGNSAKTDARRVASVSKAVCATVLAIASEQSRQGHTPRRMSFDDAAFDYIPWAQPLSDPRKARITVRQLFNHTSGICPEATGAPNDGSWEYILGLTGDARTAKLAFDPGKGCGYSSHALAHAALVCETVTGKPYDQFAIEELFKPLGIEHWWFQYYDGGEKVGRHPSHGLGMPARDLARLAYCMLRDGRWREKQVIPKWFVDETASPTHDVTTPEMRWQLNPQVFSHGWELPARHKGENGRSGEGIPPDARSKPGSGGQLIAFVPSLDLVVTRQTGSSGDWAFEEYLRRACAAVLSDKTTSRWVYPGPAGRLAYQSTPAGDQIMDFSHAGYMGGGVALPTVPVKRTVQPSGGADDTAAIQAAIDEVASLPLEGQFRGAVLLAPGTFTCTGTLSISASGVVLRGSGTAGDRRSTIKMTGRPHAAITMRRSGVAGGGRPSRDQPSPPATGNSGQSFKPAETVIADAYVPSGSSSFRVADAAGFAVGDTIEIRRSVTEAWIKFMKMDDLVRDGRRQTWLRAGSSTTCERRIALISGNNLTLDVPLSDSFDAKWLNPPGTVVARMQPPDRISQAGIEHLRIESPPQAISHTQPHFTALRINGEDCWVRDVVIEETMNSVGINGRRITLQAVAVIRKARHQGSSRPAEFAPNGGQVLLDRCSARGDNIWFAATGAGQAGPVVLLNCAFEGDGRVESHQRWSTGMLYDNCRVPGGGMDFRNRGSMGSGHGWSMGWGVAWNCEAGDYVIQNPPGAANWMIGCMGISRAAPRPFGSGPDLPAGIIDAPGTPVTPVSLYLAQLAERLGPQALKNIGY